MVFFDDFLHFLKIKKNFVGIHQNYLVALMLWYWNSYMLRGESKFDNFLKMTSQANYIISVELIFLKLALHNNPGLFTLVLGTSSSGNIVLGNIVLGTHHFTCSQERVLAGTVPARSSSSWNIGQTMFSEQITPLVLLRMEVWTLWYREHVLTGGA